MPMEEGSRSPSPTREGKRRLTENEKKANHIRSEQKRRGAIREGFDGLARLTPGLEGQGRSEAKVLTGSVEYMRSEIERRRKLVEQAQELGIDVSRYTLPEELGDAVVEPSSARRSSHRGLGSSDWNESPAREITSGNGNGMTSFNGNIDTGGSNGLWGDGDAGRQSDSPVV